MRIAKEREPRDYFEKIVILGKERAGKTSLVGSYTHDDFSEDYVATIGVDFVIFIKRTKSIVFEEGNLIKFQLWDTAGKDRFLAITRAYYKDAHGFIITMDLTDSKALEAVSFWVNELNKQFSGRKKPILIVGNKADLEQEREITYDEAKMLADKLDVIYIETSAKTRKNIDKAFEILSSSIIENLRD